MNDERKAKTALDRVLEEKEERAAKRYSAAELEKMALESENEASRLRGEPPKYKHGGYGMNEEEKKEKEEKEAKQRDKLTTSAIALINSGLDPKQVGQMLLGLTPAPSGAAVTTPAQGMGLDDVIKIVNLVSEKKESSELRDILANLGKKVDDLAKGGGGARVQAEKPLSPMEVAKQQVDYINALKELGVIKEQALTTAGGEPIEIVKEKNRHAEKMQEITIDKDYKQSLANSVAELPERIGRGIAGSFSEESEDKGSSGDNELEHILCEEKGCGTKIYITPDTGPQVKCPKCETIYTRKKETAESKAK